MKTRETVRQMNWRQRAAKLRAALETWKSTWNAGCGRCSFDEAEGDIYDHCPACRLKLIHAAVSLDIVILAEKELKRQLRFI